jgi:hypothetical protein
MVVFVIELLYEWVAMVFLTLTCKASCDYPWCLLYWFKIIVDSSSFNHQVAIEIRNHQEYKKTPRKLLKLLQI